MSNHNYVNSHDHLKTSFFERYLGVTILTFTTVVALALLLAPTLIPHSARAQSAILTLANAINLTVDDTLNIPISPIGSSPTMSSRKLDIVVNTNNTTGYTLFLSATGDDAMATALVPSDTAGGGGGKNHYRHSRISNHLVFG
jgi:hypothetical protein